MDKNSYLTYLKLFGFSFFNEVIQIDEKIDPSELCKCRLCNLYKCRQDFYKSNTKKAKVFILSEKNLTKNSIPEIENLLFSTINLALKNVYFTSIVKCSNDYSAEHVDKCKAYFFAELLSSEASILILLGENLKNILQLNDFRLGDVVFYEIGGKKLQILINYSYDFIKKNPSYEKDFINNLKKLKDKI